MHFFSTGKYKANTIRKKKTREQNDRIDTKKFNNEYDMYISELKQESKILEGEKNQEIIILKLMPN